MARELIVIGNWKMYKTAREASAYIEELLPLIEGGKPEVFLAVPFTSIAGAAKAQKGSAVRIGAQNMNDAREGAFTGEIAALMLKEAGAEFVLLGHSERRIFFGETDEFIQRKVKRALQDDLIPVLCVGETLEDRENHKTEEVLKRQIEIGLAEVPKEDAGKVILAYEPVWAIGTGKTALPKNIEEVHAWCRACLGELFGKRKAGTMQILYGGSVRSDNVGEIVAQKNVDGVLVGGASLDSNKFAEIILNCKKKVKE